jgi:hypothetical protein
LASACKTVVSGDEVHDAFDQRNRLCRCLGEQSGPRISRDLSDKACSGRGDLKKWEEFIVGKFKKRWPKDFLAKSPVENAACLQSLTFLNLELFYFELENICKRSDVDKLDEFIVFPKASPKQDGCWELVGMTLLTQADHSVVVVLQSDHCCYFYEATSPFGPPQLRTKPCAVLWSGFERKWCPEKRMMFEGIESM